MKQPEGEEKSIDLNKSTSTLPPRSEFHKTKKKKTKVKIKYPIIRLLALLFVLLPVAILSYKFNSIPDQLESTPVKKSINFESISYEDEDGYEKEQDPEIKESEEEAEKVEQKATAEKEEPHQPEVEKQVEEPTTEEPNQNVVENNSPPTVEETKVLQPVQQQEKPKDQYDVKYHTVKAEETLYRISMHYYNSRSGEELIKRWNNLDGDTVVEGQVLRIPIKLN